MRALVIADTHIAGGRSRALPGALYEHARDADAILHAGDVMIGDVLDDLARFAPVHAVLGNNDSELVDVVPATLELDLDGLAVAMVHDAGPAKGRARRLRRWFPGAGLVVFGHSHATVDEAGDGGQWLLNPGSPTQRRRQPTHTLATVDIADGRLHTTRLHDVEPPAATSSSARARRRT